MRILSTVLLMASATVSVFPAVGAERYVEPVDTATVDCSGWDRFVAPLEFTWASKDVHYRQFQTPDVDRKSVV